MILSVSARYLWLPICKAAEPVKLHFDAAGQKFQEAEIRSGDHSKETLVLLDYGMVEYFDRGGLTYGATEAAETVLQEEIRIPSGASRITIFESAGS